MTTLYQTTRGPSYDPVPVELWTWTGEPLGKLGAYDRMAFTFTGKPGAADTAELTLYLDDLTANLLPCDGTVLIGARVNGKTHLTTPVTAEAASGDNPGTAMLEVTASGGWALLAGGVIPPGLGVKLEETTASEYDLAGPLEDVVKEIVTTVAARLGHPVYVTPSNHRGPTVTARGAWENAAEVVAELLANTGYRLVMSGWLPGDPQPYDDYVFTAPCFVADVVPYRERPGLMWTTSGGEVSSWQVKRKRASVTRVVVSNGADNRADLRHAEVHAAEGPSPWGVREAYTEHEPPKDADDNVDPLLVGPALEAAGKALLAERGAAVEVSIEVSPAGGWEFGTDGVTPRQYDVGDTATVELPVLGVLTQVVTDVTVEITPEVVTVTPTVGTPDTIDLSTYGQHAELTKRLTRLERKG